MSCPGNRTTTVAQLYVDLGLNTEEGSAQLDEAMTEVKRAVRSFATFAAGGVVECRTGYGVPSLFVPGLVTVE